MLNQVQHDDGRGGTGVLRPYPPTPLSLSLSKAARKLSYTREICLNLRNEARPPSLAAFLTGTPLSWKVTPTRRR